MTDNPQPEAGTAPTTAPARTHTTGKLVGLVSIAAVAGLILGGAGGAVLGAANGARSVSSPDTSATAAPDPTVSDPGPGAEPAPTTPGQAGAEPERSERGNVVKRVGERAGIGDTEPWAVDFTVTGITVDPVCTNEYAPPSKNGHFVQLDLDIAVSADALGSFSLPFWRWINADGTTSNVDPMVGNGHTCLANAESLPYDIGVAERASGSIVLDVPATEGTLIAEPAYAGRTGEWAWEWAVPAAE